MIKLIDRISALAAYAAGVILILMVALILYEITLRSFFGASTYVMDEFVGYGVATMTFLSFAATLKDGIFIRVKMGVARMGPATRRLVEIGSCAVGTVLCAFLTWHILRIVIRDFTRGTVSNSIVEVPLWIPEAAMALGLTIFVAQFAALTIAVGLGLPLKDAAAEV